MKGLLFTELLEMVEEDFGYNTANAMVLGADLASGGIYTTARSYHRNELSVLFQQLQRQTQLPFEQLTTAFGRRLCRSMVGYPQHKNYINRIFQLIGKRHYTPVFTFLHSDDGSLTVLYNPAAKTACLTDGMVKGYLEYLRQLSDGKETVLPDGRRQCVITLS